MAHTNKNNNINGVPSNSHRATVGRATSISTVPSNLPSSLSLPQLGLTPRRGGDGPATMRVASASVQSITSSTSSHHHHSQSTSNITVAAAPPPTTPSSSGLTLPSIRSLRNRFNFAKGNSSNNNTNAGVTSPSLKTRFLPFSKSTSGSESEAGPGASRKSMADGLLRPDNSTPPVLAIDLPSDPIDLMPMRHSVDSLAILNGSGSQSSLATSPRLRGHDRLASAPLRSPSQLSRSPRSASLSLDTPQPPPPQPGTPSDKARTIRSPSPLSSATTTLNSRQLGEVAKQFRQAAENGSLFSRDSIIARSFTSPIPQFPAPSSINASDRDIQKWYLNELKTATRRMREMLEAEFGSSSTLSGLASSSLHESASASTLAAIQDIDVVERLLDQQMATTTATPAENKPTRDRVTFAPTKLPIRSGLMGKEIVESPQERVSFDLGALDADLIAVLTHGRRSEESVAPPVPPKSPRKNGPQPPRVNVDLASPTGPSYLRTPMQPRPRAMTIHESPPTSPPMLTLTEVHNQTAVRASADLLRPKLVAESSPEVDEFPTITPAKRAARRVSPAPKRLSGGRLSPGDPHAGAASSSGGEDSYRGFGEGDAEPSQMKRSGSWRRVLPASVARRAAGASLGGLGSLQNSLKGSSSSLGGASAGMGHANTDGPTASSSTPSQLLAKRRPHLRPNLTTLDSPRYLPNDYVDSAGSSRSHSPGGGSLEPSPTIHSAPGGYRDGHGYRDVSPGFLEAPSPSSPLPSPTGGSHSNYDPPTRSYSSLSHHASSALTRPYSSLSHNNLPSTAEQYRSLGHSHSVNSRNRPGVDRLFRPHGIPPRDRSVGDRTDRDAVFGRPALDRGDRAGAFDRPSLDDRRAGLDRASLDYGGRSRLDLDRTVTGRTPARDRSASLDFDRTALPGWSAERPTGDWNSGSRSAVNEFGLRELGNSKEWMGPRTARAFAAAGIDMDPNTSGGSGSTGGTGGSSIGRGHPSGMGTSWRSASERDFRSFSERAMTERSMTPSTTSRTGTSMSRHTTTSRPGTGTASVGGGSWGRKRGTELARELARGEQGSTRGSASGGGGAGTDQSSPSSRTVFSNATTTFSNSTSNSSTTYPSNPNPSQQFQDALQGMKERHDLEKEALLSALAEAKRVNKELQGVNEDLHAENEGLEREIEKLRGRIGDLEQEVDELEDRWSEAVFRNRVGEGKSAKSPQGSPLKNVAALAPPITSDYDNRPFLPPTDARMMYSSTPAKKPAAAAAGGRPTFGHKRGDSGGPLSLFNKAISDAVPAFNKPANDASPAFHKSTNDALPAFNKSTNGDAGIPNDKRHSARSVETIMERNVDAGGLLVPDAGGVGSASMGGGHEREQTRHRRTGSTTSSIFPQLDGNMTLLLQESGHDHHPSIDTISMQGENDDDDDISQPSPTMVLGTVAATQEGGTRNIPHLPPRGPSPTPSPYLSRARRLGVPQTINLNRSTSSFGALTEAEDNAMSHSPLSHSPLQQSPRTPTQVVPPHGEYTHADASGVENSPEDLWLKAAAGRPWSVDNSFSMSSVGSPESPRGSLMLRPEDELHLGDMASFDFSVAGADSDE